MRILTLALAVLAALAVLSQVNAHGPFLTLRNPEFVVFLAFLLFLGILLWFRVPARVTALLDARAEGIARDLAQARALRDEAQTLLASFEGKRREVAEQSERIVAQAREEAARAAETARADAARAVERRLRGAEEQIQAAEARAVREVRDRAVAVAVAAAREILAAQASPEAQSALIDDGIREVGARLH